MMLKALELWEHILDRSSLDLVRRWLPRLEEELFAAVPESDRVGEATQHVLRAGGRRMRPLVTMAWAEAVGGRWQRALASAAAVELVHSASLIHDDIIDGSGERRGSMAAHRKFGSHIGVLAGDRLYFTAMAIATEIPGAVGILNAACIAMCTGAALGDGVEPARLKSGSLFSAAAELGALAGGADAARVGAARTYGEQVGIAYQLRDDNLDEGSDDDGEPFVRAALQQLVTLPEAPSRKLLEHLAGFAWQRQE